MSDEKDSSGISFRKLFDVSGDFMAVASFEGYFIELNQLWLDKLGYTREELLQAPFLSFVHPEDQERTKSEAEELGTDKPSSVKFQNRYRKKDGTYIWLEWTSVSDFDDNVIFATARDITDIKENDRLNRQVLHSLINLASLSTLSNQSFIEFLIHVLQDIKLIFSVDNVSYWSFDETNTKITCLAAAESKLKPSERDLS